MKLVKGILFILNIFLISGAALTQETYFDVLINVTPSNFHYGDQNDVLQDYKKKAKGLQIGAAWQAGITSAFSLNSEFYFMMKGGVLEQNNPLTDVKTTTRLYSLELPVLARVHFKGIYLNAGPSVAYNLTGKVKTEGAEEPKLIEKLKFDGSEGAYKRWDAGVQLGGGYEFKLKKARVALDLRYHHGLVNVATEGERYNRALNFNILISKPWKRNPLAARKVMP
jgi:hypothetical protein